MLLIQPVPFAHFFFVQLQIKAPKKLCKNETCLCVRKLATDTIAGPDTERLRSFAAIFCKLFITKPAMG